MLAQRSAWALAEGSALLGSTPEAIRLASDKAKLGTTLAGIRSPENLALLAVRGSDEARAGRRPAAKRGLPFPILCKPRFGAGCRGIRWIENADFLEVAVDQALAESPYTDLLLQRIVPGRSASVAFLLGPGQAVTLPGGYQKVQRDGGALFYQGGVFPMPEKLRERAEKLGSRAIACVAELKGYVGVDLMLGEAEDGSADFVIEINPRPTTAYVGLRQLCVENLAEAWLRIVQGDIVPNFTWRSLSLDFASDGTITS